MVTPKGLLCEEAVLTIGTGPRPRAMIIAI
jgi:hypothetical protein